MTGGMMFKGTPGPWEFNIDKEDGDSIIALLYSATETLVIDADYDGSLMLKKANANLIAAAPDLLEALMLGYEGIMQYDGQKKLKEIMRAAIAKALGEQK